MSWLSSGLKKIGKVALKAAPIAAAFIPGVGPLAAAGIGAATGAIGHGKPKLSNILGGAATGALGALGAGAAGGASAAQGAAQAGGVMGKIGSVANGLKKVGDIAQPVMAGLSAYEGYQANKKAQKLSDKQLQLAEASYNERAPLRTLGRDLMLDQTPPDLSYIYANSSNPFAGKG